MAKKIDPDPTDPSYYIWSTDIEEKNLAVILEVLYLDIIHYIY